MPALPDQPRRIRSLGVERPGAPFIFAYDEGPAGDGQLRLDLMFSGISAGTELTFLKGTNPYLHSRWDAGQGVFVEGEPSARFPVNFLGYMEVARVIDTRAPGFADGDVLATTFGHKTGHTAHPDHDLLLHLPGDMDPMLGSLPRRWGRLRPMASCMPIPWNSAHMCRIWGLASPDARCWSGGGTVGLFCALFARRAGASEVVVVDRRTGGAALPTGWALTRWMRMPPGAMPRRAGIRPSVGGGLRW
ncbi:hypothetical protein [Gemmobacter sp. 24YEA27]|uniref:hypothetical protein n=1 Tax=Gemmobacter sp. 24YEA27 TaxID=3040672 RepID=UPI0024B32054|nr:hypothetical protein [Gemmobacter sp. 24YEA27]